MPRDINFTVLTGQIISTPSWIPLSNNKRALIFTLQNTESYILSNGQKASHTNNITIETLGKNAERYYDELRMHQRCQVVGYVRVDEFKGEERLRIRAFKIEDMSGDD